MYSTLSEVLTHPDIPIWHLQVVKHKHFPSFGVFEASTRPLKSIIPKTSHAANKINKMMEVWSLLPFSQLLEICVYLKDSQSAKEMLVELTQATRNPSPKLPEPDGCACCTIVVRRLRRCCHPEPSPWYVLLGRSFVNGSVSSYVWLPRGNLYILYIYKY